MKNLLITHTDLDGISPIILMNLTNQKFEYKSIEINEVEPTFEELLAGDLSAYEHIYITDLTVPEKFYIQINQKEDLKCKFKVFDHHETHLYANNYDFAHVAVSEFGHPTCGTELFYNYLKTIYENLNTPLIKDYVELVRQVDVFTFSSNRPKDLVMVMFIYSKSEFIKKISKRLQKNKEIFELTAFEKRYLKLKKEEQTNFIENKDKKMMTYLIHGRKCGVVFASNCDKSELGNVLATKHPELDLIVIIDTSKAISYRTIKDDVSVSEFAAIFGGGGHQKASGSNFDDEMRNMIVEKYFKDVKRLENQEN